MKQQELSCLLLMGMHNDTDVLEDGLAVYKTKHNFTIGSNNHTPWYLPKGVENMFTQKPEHRCS